MLKRKNVLFLLLYFSMLIYSTNDDAIHDDAILRLGLACKFKEQCIMGLDVGKNLDTKWQIHAGVEYTLIHLID
jgi:hypothetical protein